MKNDQMMIHLLILWMISIFPNVVFSDTYEPDDTWETASVITVNNQSPDQIVTGDFTWIQLHDFSKPDDKDWMIFSGNEGETYKVSVNTTAVMCNPQIYIYACDGESLLEEKDSFQYGRNEFVEFVGGYDGVYYIKIQQKHPEVHGEDTEYEITLNQPIATFTGYLFGYIQPPTPYVKISTSSDTEALSLPNGWFFIPHNAGTYTLEALGTGFEKYEQSITIAEAQSTQITINLTSETNCKDSGFYASTTSGIAPLKVSFTPNFSNPYPCKVDQWFWDFGDNLTSTNQKPEHTFIAPGTYSITMVVSGIGKAYTKVRNDYITVNEKGRERIINNEEESSSNCFISTISF